MQPLLQTRAMDISSACRTIRAWRDMLDPRIDSRSAPGGLVEAVAGLKAYLEDAADDGNSIADLVMPDHVLMTLEALDRVMLFVLRAESLEASRRRQGDGGAGAGRDFPAG